MSKRNWIIEFVTWEKEDGKTADTMMHQMITSAMLPAKVLFKCTKIFPNKEQ